VIQRRINQERPVLNGRLPGGERVNIVTPPACERGSMTVRKFPTDTMTVDRLLEVQSLNPAITTMARSLVRARKSIVVGGGTGAGKTSTLNALSRLIPIHERVVTVEDARELQIQNCPGWKLDGASYAMEMVAARVWVLHNSLLLENVESSPCKPLVPGPALEPAGMNAVGA
jgi:Flp pilus assembly CpaF family ATPase